MSYHSQENSAITDQTATRFDTGQRERRVFVCSRCGNDVGQMISPDTTVCPICMACPLSMVVDPLSGTPLDPRTREPFRPEGGPVTHTHADLDAAERRVQILERQVDHLIAWLRADGRAGSQHLDEITRQYRDMRREFPFDSEQPSPAQPEEDVDDVLREAENALDQANMAMNPHSVSSSTEIVQVVIAQSLARVRRLLDQRGVTE